MTTYLFVGALPYNQYSYVEPTPDMKMNTFFRCHIHIYEYFGGVTTRLVCDNLKTGVVSIQRKERLSFPLIMKLLGNTI